MTKLNAANTLIQLSVILFFTACSTNPKDMSIQEKESRSPVVMTLNLESAQTLVNSEGFASASKLGAMRPKAIQEIDSIRSELFNSTGASINNSVMYFSKLPNNLEFVTHTVPATEDKTELNESSIHFYGLASVLYWNSRFPETDLPFPDQVQLISGKLFSMNSNFVIEQKLSENEIVNTECTPSERIAASKIHRSLTGDARVFICKTPSLNVLAYYWFIEDSARYVVSEIWSDGDLQSKFKITDLTFH